MDWGFYGRSRELAELRGVLQRRRWFFARITGRRRIGKTTLVREALGAQGTRRFFYVQIPDSAPAGVLSAVRDAMDTFEIPGDTFAPPDSLLGFARLVEQLIRAGYVVALDEFQYFSRKHLSEFTSHLQASVDRLAAAGGVSGGLIVLGSLHAELVALLEDRDAPLYNRTTESLELGHLDVGSLLHLLDVHGPGGQCEPERLLFLWNLFEGVLKFYRDAFEQGVLARGRDDLLARMFFGASSPLRSEADSWFLSELRGRYDVVLKHIARKPGCTHPDLEAHVREISPETSEHVGGYVKVLVDRYRMIERRLPVFAKSNARQGRYYLRDNFLRSWLAALQPAVSALSFRPQSLLVRQSNERLADVEGHGLERLVAQLYEERSRLGVGDFQLTQRIEGYWDRSDTEIDLVAINEEERAIRFGTCKRNGERLVADVKVLEGHVGRFLARHPKYAAWRIERMAIAPRLTRPVRRALEKAGALPTDLDDLTRGLGPRAV
jgi:AAA+ ATPase superfamily predicted ATPase